MIIKNSNLRTGLFENRYKILAIIIAIILILCLIRAFNERAKQSIIEENEKIDKEITGTSYKPQETLIIGDTIKEEKQKESSNIMDNFINYCNKKETEKAYNLLTEECKKEIFNSDIEDFKSNYVERIFNTYKTYNIQSWINSSNITYKIRILEDVLTTGKKGDVIEDFVTIVNTDNGYKLNINSYVGRVDINKTVSKNNITVTIINKEMYMDYEIYNIKVENNTNNTILLDTKTKQKSIYMTGSNKATYSAFMHEIDNTYLTIKPKSYSQLSIKFNKIYSPNIKIDQINFTDIVMNLEDYTNSQSKTEFNRETIKVEI